jgi:hypothetical protein
LSPNFISVEANRDSSVIASIEFQNGAHNPNLAKPTPSWYIGGDVNVVGNEQLFPDMEIIKAKIGSNDDAAEDAFLNGQSIFGIDEDPVIGATPPVTYVKLYNFQSDNPYLQALVYYVTVRIQDAGDFQDIVFEIDMSLDLPTNVIQNQVASGFVFSSAYGIPYPFTTDWNNDGETPANIVRTGYPYTLLDLTSATIPGLLPHQRGYYIYAGGFFNNSFETNAITRTRSSESLCSYSGVPEDLIYGGPPIVIPFDNADAQGHKVIKDTDPTVVTFGGTTPIQVYSVCQVTNVETVSEPYGGGGGATVLTVNLISGNFPTAAMSIANGTSTVPTTFATWFPSNYPTPGVPEYQPVSGGYQNGYQQVYYSDIPNNKIYMLGRITGGGSSIGTPPIDVQVGDTVYFFKGWDLVLNGSTGLSLGAVAQQPVAVDWWLNGDYGGVNNPVIGSPWYFSQDLNKVKKMYEYSPWAGICTSPAPTVIGQSATPWTHSCPKTTGSMGLDQSYAGIDCEVQNYSNLNFEII